MFEVEVVKNATEAVRALGKAPILGLTKQPYLFGERSMFDRKNENPN